MKGWRRARARLRRKLLGWLLPEQREKINTRGYTPLVVVVPMPTGLLDGPHSDGERAELCTYAGEAARITAAQAVRNRVGSSAARTRSPEQVFDRLAPSPYAH